MCSKVKSMWGQFGQITEWSEGRIDWIDCAPLYCDSSYLYFVCFDDNSENMSSIFSSLFCPLQCIDFNNCHWLQILKMPSVHWVHWDMLGGPRRCYLSYEQRWNWGHYVLDLNTLTLTLQLTAHWSNLTLFSYDAYNDAAVVYFFPSQAIWPSITKY